MRFDRPVAARIGDDAPRERQIADLLERLISLCVEHVDRIGASASVAIAHPHEFRVLSSADANGNITVRPGDHIPSVPATTVKLRLDYAATAKWRIGTNLTWRGSVYAQGDENNQDVNGMICGYLLIDMDTAYQVTKQLQVFASVSNLLDKRYASFGALGENFFTGPGGTFNGANTVNEQFVGPGAPRSFWVGMRYAWK